MKFLDKKISESYYQTYIILSVKEKNDIVDEVKRNIFELKKKAIEEEIKTLSNLKNKQSFEISFKEINELKIMLDNISIDTMIFEDDEIEEEIYNNLMYSFMEHADYLKIAPTLDRDCSLIGNLYDDNSITVIFSFCYIPYDFNLVLPNKKGNPYLFTYKDVDMIQTEILLAKNYYDLVESEEVTDFSDLLFDISSKKYNDVDLCLDINKLESEYAIDRDNLIGLKCGEHVLRDYLENDVKINIKKIYEKKVLELNDDIVKEIGFLNSQNVIEFRNNIKKAYSFILNANSNIISILHNIIESNNIVVDDYVLKHFSKTMSFEYDMINMEKIIYDIKMTFINSLIISIHRVDYAKYQKQIKEEFELLQLIGQVNEIEDYEDFVGYKFPIYIVYDFFKCKNLVTERS